MIRLEAIRLDPATLAEYAGLFRAVFPRSAQFSPAYLDWLYGQNPDGPALGFNAWLDRRLVAHYACVPSRIRVDGQSARAMLSLNTATHPEFQGKGLFTKLAQATYALALANGIQGVYGVANAQSTPGFVGKLGFQNVGPLHAGIGWGRLHLDWAALDRSTRFRREWDPTSLLWRMRNPKNPVRAMASTDCTLFCAAGPVWGVHAYAELDVPVHGCSGLQPLWQRPGLQLFLGLVPVGARARRVEVPIPQRWRPSPLNLIYRSLADLPGSIDRDTVSFSFLDFDAY